MPVMLGVGVRAADEIGMGHAVDLDVVDIAALAGDEATIFLAHDARANAFNAHAVSPCRAASTAPFGSADRSRL